MINRDSFDYNYINLFSSASLSEKISHKLTGYTRDTSCDWVLLPIFSIIISIVGIVLLRSEYDAISNFVGIPFIVLGILLFICSICFIVCSYLSKKYEKEALELKEQKNKIDNIIAQRKAENDKILRKLNKF